MDILHPAYAEGVRRGTPARVTVGATDYPIDSEGYFAVEDEAEAEAAMDRLAQTYGVEYDDEGEVVAGGDTTDDTRHVGPDSEDADDLRAMDMDALRDRADAAGVDTDAVDMRSKDDVIDGILRAEQ